jgi:hypothetical protein
VAAAGEAAGGSGAELWRDLPPALLDTWAQGNEERLGGMRAVGASSALRLPLRTLERRLGTMTLLGKQPRPPFSERDLHQAEELAARCSLAIENAQVYRAARRPSERRFTRRTDLPAVPRPEPGESR